MAEIPYTLQIKLLQSQDQLKISTDGTSVPSVLNLARNNTIIISADPKEFDFCYQWMKAIMNGAQSWGEYSYKKDVGPLMGIWPCELLGNRAEIVFSVDRYDETKRDWRDWFREV